jgi:hypothetical protein
MRLRMLDVFKRSMVRSLRARPHSTASATVAEQWGRQRAQPASPGAPCSGRRTGYRLARKPAAGRSRRIDLRLTRMRTAAS